MSKEKLVRDNMPDLCNKLPGWTEMKYRIASKEELKTFLNKKLLEEANELVCAHSTENMIEEMADILEVIYALQDLEGIQPRDVGICRMNKFNHRGGFSKGVIWDGNK